MRYSVEEAMISLCMDKHGDTEIHWTGVAENFNSLDNVKRNDGEKLKFTWAEVQEKQKVLDKEFTDTQYQRDRQIEYPTVEELVVALYDTDDKSAIEAKRAEVKKKYPKP